MEQSIDSRVSRVKFDREITAYRRLEDTYMQRGWFLVRATFPEVFILLVARQLNPSPVVFGAKFDFTDYDFRPPSVRIVDPFTSKPFKAKELTEPAKLWRKGVVKNQEIQTPQGRVTVQVPQMQQLMQFHDPDAVPFLCLAGVREYHEHPAHTGDNWLLHRTKGEGTLFHILSVLSKYGVDSIKKFNFELNLSLKGFQIEAPE